MVNMSRMKLRMLENALALSVLIAAGSASAALAQAFGLLLAHAGFVGAAVPRHAAPAAMPHLSNPGWRDLFARGRREFAVAMILIAGRLKSTLPRGS